jgi:hypothetical protein
VAPRSDGDGYGQARVAGSGVRADPTMANSSYEGKGSGIRAESLEAWREVLSADAVATIEAGAIPLDREVRALADVA